MLLTDCASCRSVEVSEMSSNKGLSVLVFMIMLCFFIKVRPSNKSARDCSLMSLSEKIQRSKLNMIIFVRFYLIFTKTYFQAYLQFCGLSYDRRVRANTEFMSPTGKYKL